MKPKRVDSLKLNYRKTFELCMIIILVIHIILFQVVRTNKHSITQYKIEQIKIEVVQIPKTWQKQKIQRPKPPTRPTVPIPMEEEYIPEDLTIIPTKLDLSNIPSPPAPPLEEYDYENYSFIPYQIPPKIIGGMNSIRKMIHYPEIAKKAGIEGQTILGLLIDKYGNVIKCIILKHSFKILDQEALRVAMKIKFYPAQQREKAVKIWLSMPFRFRLK